jgi:hypothetical protein
VAPPARAVGPPVPALSPHACWARHTLGGAVIPARPGPAARPARAPHAIVESFLRRFGDRTVLASARTTLVPDAAAADSGLFGKDRPPRDARWLSITTRLASGTGLHGPAAGMLKDFEVDLTIGALRDDFCTAGGPPLVGWSVDGDIRMVSDANAPFDERFPNPTALGFRRELAGVARRYGFRVVSLRLLRPEQLAPMLVVETDRDRTEFVHDVAAIQRLLDPIAHRRLAFEGFMLVVERDGSPFVAVSDIARGQVASSQWSANRCVYPYLHGAPFGQKLRCGWK